MRHLPHQLPRAARQPTLARLIPAPSLRHPPSSTLSRASSTTTATTSSTKKKPTLTLEHFLLRQRVLGLYRTITRALASSTLSRDAPQRRELQAYARAEFERHRDVTDAGKIRYLVSTGKTEFDGMKRYLEEMGR